MKGDPMNPYQSPAVPFDETRGKWLLQSSILQAIATGLVAFLLTVVCWVGLVGVLDRHFIAYENLVWASSLWASALLWSGLVAYSRYSVVPILSCPLAFGAFGLMYMLCEGPIFGDVSNGGDPSITHFVVWNLICLPLGVFVATAIGFRFRLRRKCRYLRTVHTDEQMS